MTNPSACMPASYHGPWRPASDYNERAVAAAHQSIGVLVATKVLIPVMLTWDESRNPRQFGTAPNVQTSSMRAASHLPGRAATMPPANQDAAASGE
jgi:hypothetical protein